MKKLICILCFAILALSLYGCEKAKVPYSIELPDKIQLIQDNESEGDLLEANFEYEESVVGGLCFYAYKNNDELLTLDKLDQENFFNDFYRTIGYTVFFDENVSHMGGSSQHADLEMWISEEHEEEDFSCYHYYYLLDNDLICDLWFNDTVFTAEEIHNVLESLEFSEELRRIK